MTSLARRTDPALQQAKAWWRQRPKREQWLLMGAVVATLLVAIDAVWTAPLQRQARRVAADLATRQEALAQLTSATTPPGADAQQLRSDEQALRKRMLAAQQLSDQLGRETAALPQLLRSITGAMGSVRLLALELAPDAGAGGAANAALLAGQAQAQAQAKTGQAAASAPDGAPRMAAGRQLYHLPVTLKVSGSYGDLQQLLARLEREAPSLRWQTLSLDSSDWPAIRLTLQAEALSQRPTWGAAP